MGYVRRDPTRASAPLRPLRTRRGFEAPRRALSIHRRLVHGADRWTAIVYRIGLWGTMDATRIAARINGNLTWAAAVGLEGPLSPIEQPLDVWSEIKAQWAQPDHVFAPFVYLILLGRPGDSASLNEIQVMLARGAPRSALVRRLARSAEAQARGLEMKWLPDLDALDKDAVWDRVLQLWKAPDRSFVEGLYPVLLGRPADAVGAGPLRRALAAGMSRSAAARCLLLSAEGRACGANASSLLPRLNALEAAAVWERVRALWQTPNSVFAQRLYPILLGRRADSASVKGVRAILIAGAPRVSVVRRIALSEEAQAQGLDVSWLPRMEELEPDAVWLRVQALWAAPDEPFVQGLFYALLGRSAEETEAAELCGALANGSRRAVVVRDLAESDDARASRLHAPWLPLLDAMPTGRASGDYPFTSSSLKSAFARWLTGWKVTIPAPKPNAKVHVAMARKDALEELSTTQSS